MENSNKRPYPTGPGWWYRRGGWIVHVLEGITPLVYREVGIEATFGVVDDGNWLGPVPMPGAIEALNDALTEAEAIMGGEYGDHYGPFADMVDEARKLAGVTP